MQNSNLLIVQRINGSIRFRLKKTLKHLLTQHQNPGPNLTVERFKFSSQISNTNESVSTYITELQKLKEDCKYGDSLKTWWEID